MNTEHRSMNPMDKLFTEKKKDILSVYFTAGFPKLESTNEILSELESQEVDLVEIGMPFSDPLADGPVIQQASTIALENGMSIGLLFEQLFNYRTKSQEPRAKSAPLQTPSSELPTLLMGYLNPVMQFGMEKFLAKCVECNISGVILPDLPLEVYEEEYKTLFEKHNVHFIFLVTPLTSEQRLKKIASLSKGFVYLVSSASTTGKSGSFSEEQRSAMKRVREIIPQANILTGFGIHNYETRQIASEFTNGVVVGTAFIRELGKADAKTAVGNLLDKLNENVTA